MIRFQVTWSSLIFNREPSVCFEGGASGNADQLTVLADHLQVNYLQVLNIEQQNWHTEAGGGHHLWRQEKHREQPSANVQRERLHRTSTWNRLFWFTRRVLERSTLYWEYNAISIALQMLFSCVAWSRKSRIHATHDYFFWRFKLFSLTLPFEQ